MTMSELNYLTTEQDSFNLVLPGRPWYNRFFFFLRFYAPGFDTNNTTCLSSDIFLNVLMNKD